MKIGSSRPPGPGPDGQPAFLGPALAGDPARPLLTYYDDATGERTELSAVTLGNWVVKTANLLLEECGLDPGDRAAVLLPAHWQTAAVLLGAWTAGLSVDYNGTGPAVGEAAGPYDVVFAAVDRMVDLPGPAAAGPAAGHRFALGLAPMGVPLPEPPAGWQDYSREVLAQGDHLVPYAPGDATAYREWAAAARERAEAAGLRSGDRLLFRTETVGDPVEWLLAPLWAGASVVLCAHLDPAAVAARAQAERATAA